MVNEMRRETLEMIEESDEPSPSSTAYRDAVARILDETRVRRAIQAATGVNHLVGTLLDDCANLLSLADTLERRGRADSARDLRGSVTSSMRLTSRLLKGAR